jgi:hypothetical protein
MRRLNIIALWFLVFTLTSGKTNATVIQLAYPGQGAALYQTIPYFSWNHDISGYFNGYYEIVIAENINFTQPVDIDTVPSFVKYYSPDFELKVGVGYFWKVRYLNSNYQHTNNTWSETRFFRIYQPVKIIDVATTDGWAEIRTKWQSALKASKTAEGAVELRFPVNHVFNIRQDPTGVPEYKNQYLLYADGFSNLTINGRGSKIILEATLPSKNEEVWRKLCGFLLLTNSSGVQVKDIIIDYHPNSLLQFGGKVKDFNTQTRTFKVVVDTTVYKNFDEFITINRGYFIDKANKQKIGRLGVDFGMDQTWAQAKVNDTLFQFTAGSSEWGRYSQELQDGDYFVSSERAGDIIFLLSGVNNFVVNNMITHASRGRYFATGAGNYIRCINNSYLCTQGRIMGSSSGGVGVCRSSNTWYEGNRYEYTRDDTFHNGSNEGVNAVFRKNYIVGSYRNAIWIQADKSWVSENIIEYAGTNGIHLGYAATKPGTNIDVALIEKNRIINPRWIGIYSRTNPEFPDWQTGSVNNDNVVIRNNFIQNNFRDQGLWLKNLKNAHIENNIVTSDITNWQVYSDPSLQIGVQISESENVSGIGNLIDDNRVLPFRYLFIEHNSKNIAISMLTKNITAPSHLSVVDSAYNKVELTWSDNSTNETTFKILRRTKMDVNYRGVAVLQENVTNFIDTTVLPETEYYYMVFAENSDGGSLASNEIILTTPKQTLSTSGKPTFDINTIFPNPSSNGIFLMSRFSDYVVLNSTGKIVMKNSNTNKIDLSSYAAGIYFLIDKQAGEQYKLLRL